MPVSIISFSIFGFVAFAQHFDISRWHEPVTAIMILLALGSPGFLFAAMACLAKVDEQAKAEWKVGRFGTVPGDAGSGSPFRIGSAPPGCASGRHERRFPIAGLTAHLAC